MLNLNGFNKVGKSYFPDGSQMLLDVDVKKITAAPTDEQIFWQYEGDEECMTLYYLVKHLRANRGEDVRIHLYMKYLPNARMDRVKDTNKEVFTLKYFCEFINSLKFASVHVLDPHSDVGVALLDRVVVDSIAHYVSYAVSWASQGQGKNSVIIFFPDAGAYKRYKDMPCIAENEKIYGQKVRNWETGKIEGLKVLDRDSVAIDSPTALEGKTVLMIDDIISYGGTLYYSAKQLKALGAEKIYAYATHTENSVLDKEKGTFIKCLEDGTVEKLFTTESIFSGKHENIVVC